jgi:hypothetical protein
MKKCLKCLQIKPINKYRICRLYKGIEQGKYYRAECIDCEKKLSQQLRKAKIDAKEKPSHCECCGKETTILILDHDHTTGKFRGWICRNCNQGIGKLGDDLKGLQKAVKYLQSSHSSTG